jgi:hypothetical protein
MPESVKSCHALNRPGNPDLIREYTVNFDGISITAWLCVPHRQAAGMLKGLVISAVKRPTPGREKLDATAEEKGWTP